MISDLNIRKDNLRNKTRKLANYEGIVSIDERINKSEKYIFQKENRHYLSSILNFEISMTILEQFINAMTRCCLSLCF
uniref:Transposase n=1 Tax=Caenorhabditis tropicalis TaxID=1561998 RepID=A0A1I7SXD2_9PELO